MGNITSANTTGAHNFTNNMTGVHNLTTSAPPGLNITPAPPSLDLTGVAPHLDMTAAPTLDVSSAPPALNLTGAPSITLNGTGCAPPMLDLTSGNVDMGDDLASQAANLSLEEVTAFYVLLSSLNNDFRTLTPLLPPLTRHC